MHVWLSTVGEPLPTLSGNSRLWRTGMLAEELVRRGHSVTWWTSRVDHIRKEFFACDRPALEVQPGLTLRFLDGRLYKRNISIARLANHYEVGRQFREQADAAPRPDVILCSFPTIELSLEAVRFARRQRVPIALDVRDLWPDIFLQPAPPALRWAVRLVLSPYFSATRSALSDADALIAVSDRYLEWGLQRAGRAKTASDLVFPLAYSLPARTPQARDQGRTALGRFGVRSDSIVCIFAGTLGRTYDLGPVMSAAATLAARGNHRFRFVICGDGERAEEWKSAAAGLPNVSFTGWLAQQDMRAALMGADIGLAAYAKGAPQGVPNKVIEYLAAGLPVVSSLEGETEQLLARDDIGRTYSADDEAALTEALLALESPVTRLRLAGNARVRFEADFQAETVYARLAGYLESLRRRAAA